MYFHNIVIDGINIDDFVGVWYSGPLVGHIGISEMLHLQAR
jgi:hypothetical protein